jgi:hypothetical protein
MELQGDPLSPVPDAVEVELSNGKRRWRRNRVACDSCHTRRVRCDRAFPCSRCLRGDINCQFTRERRKRGRIARSKQKNGNANAGDETAQDPTEGTQADGEHNRESQSQQVLSPIDQNSPASTFQQRSPATNEISAVSAPSVDDPRSVPDPPQPQRAGPAANATEEWLSAAHLSPDSYDLLAGTGGSDAPLPRLMDIWNPVDFAGLRPVQRAPPIPSVSGANLPRQRQPSTSRSPLKYPVLEPLMPFLESNLPRRLVCDLLELYFTSAFSTHMHPVCHHIHCYVLRKTSFLSVDRPRPTSPALLASMLWVAAVDDRAFSLSISPLQRRRICQFLCALIIRLLRPLIHVSFKDQDPSPAENPTAHDFSAGAHHPFEGVGDDKGLVGPAGSLDDVITYIHVASIISSSEQKAASMRWFVVPLFLSPVHSTNST